MYLVKNSLLSFLKAAKADLVGLWAEHWKNLRKISVVGFAGFARCQQNMACGELSNPKVGKFGYETLWEPWTLQAQIKRPRSNPWQILHHRCWMSRKASFGAIATAELAGGNDTQKSALPAVRALCRSVLGTPRKQHLVWLLVGPVTPCIICPWKWKCFEESQKFPIFLCLMRQCRNSC